MKDILASGHAMDRRDILACGHGRLGPPARVLIAFMALLYLASTLLLTSCGSSSSPHLMAPSNLVYPQATISATIGQAISPDAPTVSGTVTTYGVSPPLPAGLTLSSSSGTLSGTPSALAPQATYTVTAQNSSGSATATLKIVVNPLAPSNLSYPQTTIATFVGLAIMPDVPTASGTVTSFSVTPALPAGLSLDAATGVIMGTPTGAAAQTAYTITASNGGGAVSASVTITVGSAANILLELGHGSQISAMRFQGDRVLSVDVEGHWNLWDYTSGTPVASGDGSPSELASYPGQVFNIEQIDMAGQIFVVGIPNGLEVCSVSDGHLIALLIYAGVGLEQNVWWQLASDGSNITIGSNLGLSIFSTAGQLLATKAGNYSSAKAFSANGTVLVAVGAAGQNVIERIATANGASTISPTFSGQFNSWFVDAPRFLTNQGNMVWVYSQDAVQQAAMSLPTIENITGQGNWIWTYADVTSPQYPLEIFAVGSSTPALTYPVETDTLAIPSGSTIGILPVGAQYLGVIDLSGTTPTSTNYDSIPINTLRTYAARSSSQWVASNISGVLLDGDSLALTPRYFGHGAAWSIAGSSNRVAVSTAIGETLVFNLSGPALEESINFPSGELALSTDESVLGAMGSEANSPNPTEQTLNFYSLPSASIIKSYSYPLQSGVIQLFDYSLAASGTIFGQEMGTQQSSGFARIISPLSGSPVIWSDAPPSLDDPTLDGPPGGVEPTLHLSPDGTSFTASSYSLTNMTSSAQIFTNGKLVATVPGFAIGWIDNGRILVNQYALSSPPAQAYIYSGAAIYNSTGSPLATLPEIFPELRGIQPVTPDSVYEPYSNSIYSLTTGQEIWMPTYGDSVLNGALAGPYVVYQSGYPTQTGHNIVLELH